MKTTGIVKLQYLSGGKLHQARTLRLTMTVAEKKLWDCLRRKKLGVKFRRQQIIEGFIADFYCEAAKLVIEVDGAVHDSAEQKKIDERRKKVFEHRGLQEIRFSNEQIESDLENVITRIQSLLPAR